jgi:hypothetical protein
MMVSLSSGWHHPVRANILMKIKHLNLLLTYRCPSQCRHCCYFGGLEGTGLMTAAQVNAYLRDLNDHPLDSVWIYGGEPFLYPSVLTEIVKIARRKNIPEIGVLTNGYWATRERGALKLLHRLKETGLTAITVSTDGFHAQRIAPEWAIRAGRLALDTGIEEVTYSVAFLPPRGSSNYYNNLSEKIWDRLASIPGASLREENVTTIGRAAETLLEYYQLKKIRTRHRCRPPYYIGGSWSELQGLEIDPYGWVMVCPGLSLGRVGQHSLNSLLQQYDDNGNILWRTLRDGGAAGLLDLALHRGYRPSPKYVDTCHLCYEVRKYLRPHFRSYLAPDGCYREPHQAGRGFH